MSMNYKLNAVGNIYYVYDTVSLCSVQFLRYCEAAVSFWRHTELSMESTGCLVYHPTYKN